MPQELRIQSVRDRMPVRYRVNPIVRVPAMILHTLLVGWSLWVLFSYVRADSAWWIKVLPLVVLFVSLDSLFRHLTSLNAVIFTPECLWLRYILKPPVAIEYDRIVSLELRKVLTYYVFLGFTDRSGKKRLIKTQASFPRMIEIMYNIADLAPQIVMNEELNKMIEVIRNIKNRQEQAEQ
ncbi:MAG: hypothetical protein K0B87_04545 [Candidatus Syntrophosphaera sp.]|nr:hypothetical protein [Candidatus Syntrophosphaera sp.]